jgi:signal transduction histidine kinase
MPDASVLEDRDASAERDAAEEDARLLRRVRWRLVTWSGLATLVVLAVLGTALYLGVANALDQSGVAALDARAAPLQDLLEGPDNQPPNPTTGLIFGGGGTFAVIIGPGDQLIGRRDQPVPVGLPDMASVAAARTSGRDVRTGTLQGIPIRVLSVRATNPTVGTLVIQIVGDRQAEIQALDVLVAVLVIGGVIAVLVAAAFGTAYAQRALVPIRESLVAQRSALRRQRQFAADASHELRTPLTVVRSSVELLRRHRDEPVASVGDALDDIAAEVDNLTRMVDDLLLLARSDSGALALEHVPVDLADVAGDAVASLSGPASERGVRLELAPEPVVVTGDPARLRQLAVIVTDNAIRHAPAGSAVRIGLRREVDHATLTIEDAGPGIRPEDLPHVFDRFWRAADAPSGGTGLGLSIAAWIAEQHGATIHAANRDEGGARFTIRFPLNGQSDHLD